MQLEHVTPPLILTRNSTSSTLQSVNYPLDVPANLVYKTTVTSPSGFNIRVALPVSEWNQKCEEDYLEVIDVETALFAGF